MAKIQDLDNPLGIWSGPLKSCWTEGIAEPTGILFKGEMTKKYRLDSRNEQRRLLDGYKKILNVYDSEEWCRENGTPGFMANSSQRVYSCSEDLTAIVQSAGAIRALLAIYEGIRRAQLDFNFEKLRSLIAQPETLVKSVKGPFHFKDLSKAYFANEGTLESVELPFIYFKKNIQTDNESLLECAKSIVETVGNIMIRGVQPKLKWATNSDEEWALRQEYAILCPWQGVASEVIRVITGCSVQRCPHPLCGKPMANKKLGAQSCGDDRCRQYVYRLKRKDVSFNL